MLDIFATVPLRDGFFLNLLCHSDGIIFITFTFSHHIMFFSVLRILEYFRFAVNAHCDK